MSVLYLIINNKVFFNVILCIFKYSIGDLFSFFNKRIKREIESINAKENPISSLNSKLSCRKNTKKKLIINVIIYLHIFMKKLKISFIL